MSNMQKLNIETWIQKRRKKGEDRSDVIRRLKDRTGLNDSQLSKYINGKYRLPITIAYQFALELRCRIEDFLTEDLKADLSNQEVEKSAAA